MNRLQQNTIITAVCITFRRDSLYNPYNMKHERGWKYWAKIPCFVVVLSLCLTLQSYHTIHALGLGDEKEGPRSASPVTVFILIYPEPTQERSGQTYVLSGLGHRYPERCIQIAIPLHWFVLPVFSMLRAFFNSAVLGNVEKRGTNGAFYESKHA